MTTKRVTLFSLLTTALLWAPVLLLPFSALFLETRVQLSIFHANYRDTLLKQEIQVLQQEIKDLRAHEAELEAMRRLEAMAPELGLVAPNHDQIILVQVPEDIVTTPYPIAFAQLAPNPSGTSVAPVSKPNGVISP